MEPRTLIADLLEEEWGITPTPDIVDHDEPRYPEKLVPLIKVYPVSVTPHLRDRGYGQRVEHHLTVSIRSKSQANSYAAMEEACRILDLYLDHPWTGYDLMMHQGGAYRSGPMYISQWDIEVTIYQMRKVVVRR